MNQENYLTGPFAPMREAFVAQKRASGLDYTQQEMLLRMFDNFRKDYEVQNDTVTKEIAVPWCKNRSNEKDVARHD